MKTNWCVLSRSWRGKIGWEKYAVSCDTSYLIQKKTLIFAKCLQWKKQKRTKEIIRKKEEFETERKQKSFASNFVVMQTIHIRRSMFIGLMYLPSKSFAITNFAFNFSLSQSFRVQISSIIIKFYLAMYCD